MKYPQKKYRLGTVSKNILLEGLNRFHDANLTLSSDVYLGTKFMKSSIYFLKNIYIYFIGQNTWCVFGKVVILVPIKSLWKERKNSSALSIIAAKICHTFQSPNTFLQGVYLTKRIYRHFRPACATA